jgi:acyl dehydratase
VDVATPANPKGIFDRSAKGRSLAPVNVLVERGSIRFFSRVLGQIDSIHYDVEAARAAGHPDLVAPPSYLMVIEALASDELKRRGAQTAAELVNFDFRYLLHGDETYAYRAPIYAGEEVAFSTRVVDFYDKRGGAMEFAKLECDVTHAERGVLVRATRTLLHRLPGAAS